jgi:uncharacterized protein (DUF433 family)
MKKYIVSDSEIMSGKPCIAGTRIPVALLLTRIRQGYSLKEIQKQYPHVQQKMFEGALNELANQVNYDSQNLQT